MEVSELDTLAGRIADALLAGQEYEVPGLGTFTLSRKTRLYGVDRVVPGFRAAPGWAEATEGPAVILQKGVLVLGDLGQLVVADRPQQPGEKMVVFHASEILRRMLNSSGRVARPEG